MQTPILAMHGPSTPPFPVAHHMAPDWGSAPLTDSPHWQSTALPQKPYHIHAHQHMSSHYERRVSHLDEILGSLQAQVDMCDSATKGQATTLMMCNVPCKSSPEIVAAAVESAGFGGHFDYLYVPSSGAPYNPWAAGIGYAFINFPNPEIAALFVRAFTGFRFTQSQSTKVIEVKKAANQGVVENLMAIRANRLSRLQPSRRPFVEEQAMKQYMKQRG